MLVGPVVNMLRLRQASSCMCAVHLADGRAVATDSSSLYGSTFLYLLHIRI